MMYNYCWAKLKETVPHLRPPLKGRLALLVWSLLWCAWVVCTTAKPSKPQKPTNFEIAMTRSFILCGAKQIECGPVFCSCSNHCNKKLTPQRGRMHMKKKTQSYLLIIQMLLCVGSFFGTSQESEEEWRAYKSGTNTGWSLNLFFKLQFLSS